MQKLYIWGRGQDAEKLMELSPFLRMLVDGIIDSARKEETETFWGKPVYRKEDIEWTREVYVIIATRQYYSEIADFLEIQNLRYMEDYCDYAYAWRKWRAAVKNSAYNIRINNFFNSMRQLEKWVPNVEQKVISNGDSYRRYVLEGGVSSEKAVLECCVERQKKQIELENAVIEYDQLDDLAVMMHEILISEDYYFDSDADIPEIIDGGANIGIAIYYFKQIYPDSHITAFEPNPEMYRILERNIARNAWKNIEIHPLALSDLETDSLTFYIQKSGMAGSLEKRNMEGVNEEITEIQVPSTRLNQYIASHVDYIKLDIEGSETKVIEALEDKLTDVDHIFIEFHEGRLKGHNSIAKITTLLEQKGFDINISKSYSSAGSMDCRPMLKVGSRISEVLWAKKNN